MRDEDDGDPLLPQRAHDGEQVRDLVLGEGRRRLVHDEDLRVLQERAADLHDLLVGGVQVGHHLPRIDRDVELGQDGARLRAHALHVHEAQARAELRAEKKVLIDAQVVDEIQFLVDEADAQLPRGRGCRDDGPGPADEDLPRIRGKHPAEDVHEGGLSGAVLADQGVYLADGD